jgi:hypothetical protein
MDEQGGDCAEVWGAGMSTVGVGVAIFDPDSWDELRRVSDAT